ncbi:MAG TPA: UDP-N-acetylmuramoyl-tripeptide--D-alanyl-D-alanine ligase [Verrucomicrobiae bacterium]
MNPLPLRLITRACDGELVHGSPETLVRRVCTDSRQSRAGDLFVALRGERFDGHDFLTEASAQAAGIMVNRSRAWSNTGPCAVIVVDDTCQALGRLAADYRQDFALPIIAVAGSNGKTTTKELLASVMRQRLATLWSEASFNNLIGVPLSLLALEGSHEAAILEVGTNHPGELEPLVRMIAPRYGVITSIGREHLEFFGDLAGVAHEEGMLAELLPASGKLFLNGDSEWSGPVAERSRAPVVRVGFAERNDWSVRAARVDMQGVTFQVAAPISAFAGEYRISLLGRHQTSNALFAIALGVELGLTRDEIGRGLAECKPMKMRMQLWEFSGVRVLDDAYNANADSMTAALQTMKELPCKGRRVAVLGDMAELGTHSESAHEEVGRRAAELGIGQLFAVGRMAPVMARGARAGGLNRVLEFTDVETVAGAVRQFVKEGDVLLLKGSRATRLERVAELLRGGESLRKGLAGGNGK